MPSDPTPSPLSLGIMWAYRISAVGLEFSLPALAGSFLDRRWGTAPWVTLVGAVLGFALGITHLIRLSTPPRSKNSIE